MAGALNRILHVDDDSDIQEITRLSLESIGGLTVETCSSAAEALRRAPVFRPDLLLLDVLMPDMDGVELLRRLKEEAGLGEVPVVFMTSKVETIDLTRYLRAGALDIITKPFDYQTLPDSLREIWNAR